MRFTVAALALVWVGPFATRASRVQRGSSRPNPPAVSPTAFHGGSSEAPDDTAAAPDETEADQEVEELTQSFEEGVGASESFAELNTSATVVKLMVVWTRAFECKRLNNELNREGSVCRISQDSGNAALRFINKAIARVEQAFIDSKIGARLEVVHKRRHLAYVEAESGGLVGELVQLNGCKIDGLCDIRAQVGAHIVAAYTDKAGVRGQARFGPDRRLRSAALGRGSNENTLAHEIGHLFGCREDRQTMNNDDGVSCDRSETWFGYRSPDLKWADIMGYPCELGKYDCSIDKVMTSPCKLTRLPVYSDPNIMFKPEGQNTEVQVGSKKSCCACTMRMNLPTIVNKLPYDPTR